jgi:hypothetical protein
MAEQHACAACGQSFGSKRELDDHNMKSHGEMGKKGGEAEGEVKESEAKTEEPERPS